MTMRCLKISSSLLCNLSDERTLGTPTQEVCSVKLCLVNPPIRSSNPKARSQVQTDGCEVKLSANDQTQIHEYPQECAAIAAKLS